MIKKQIRMNVRAVVVAVLAISVLVSPQTFAQSSNKANNSTNVLKVSPVRSDIEIKPGETKTVKTVVTNLTESAITIRPVENDFIAGDERGTPALILDADKFAPTHSLKRFMKPLADVTIAAKEAKAIDVTIAVPANAKAGGYFGAVRFAPTSPDGGGQVNLSTSAASLILLTVPGDITEELNLSEFNIQQDGKNATYFQTSKNLQATFRFENKGGAQVGPLGKVSVKQGDKVLHEVDFNNKTPRDVILPDSARRWDVPLEKIGDFGNYTVSATFTYGAKNQTIEVSKSFWVIPSYFIIIAVLGLIVLIAVIVGVWWFLRSYKRRVISDNDRNKFRR